MKKVWLFLSFSVLATAGWAKQQQAGVSFPGGYRKWQHVKSMVIQQGHSLYDAFGGIHHIYANPAAVQGYQKGNFPNGSVIVFDLLEAPSENNAITEATRKVLGVMQKDSKKFSNTGGWGFEAFGGGNPRTRLVKENAVKTCFGCHSGQKDNDYVFSRWRK